MLALTITAYAIGIVLLGCGTAILISMRITRKNREDDRTEDRTESNSEK